ncbi:4'-phosphopantetheinyl transferase family protein [Frateuria aurantia]
MAVRESRPGRVLLQALRLPANMGVEVGLDGPAPPPPPYHWLPSRIRHAPSRRRGGLAGSFCAQRALNGAGYAGTARIKAETDRPASWPPGWTGSIGWADAGAVAVAAPLEPGHWVGVDLSTPLTELQRRWLEPLLAQHGELEVLTRRSTECVSLLYSAKEALQRALQPLLGEIIDYQAIRCIRMDADWLWFVIEQPLGPDWPSGRPIRVRYVSAPGWVLTVATNLQQAD